MKYYLGLDNGGTITKAAIYDEDGNLISLSSTETKSFSIQPNYVERNMKEMRDANIFVLKDVLSKSGINASEIRGIASCGHGKGLYLVDSNGEPVRNGILSSDNRAWAYVEKWKANGVSFKVYSKTCSSIMACQPVSLLAWLKDNESENYSKIRWIFECKDYVRFLLTGLPYAELTDYSGANFVNLYTRQYDDELLSYFGLSDIRPCLPPLISSTDFAGGITEQVAKETGLEVGTPVFGGMFDIDACAIASGVSDSQYLAMVAGTWSINEYCSKEPVGEHKVAMNSVFCNPQYILAEESSATSAVNLEYMAKTIFPNLSEDCKKNGKNVYQEFDRLVSSVPATDMCPIYLPFIVASNVHPNAQASFVGMSAWQTLAHFIKAVFEGVAFSHKYHTDKLLSARGDRPTVRLSGGVANSTPWIQIFADVLNLSVETVDVKEAGTLGCAMCIAVATGDKDSFESAFNSWIDIKQKIEPIAKNVKIYNERYKVYMKVLNALDPVWETIQQNYVQS